MNLLARRFHVKGVFWRKLNRWALFNVPLWIEPIILACWSLFFLLWGTGRRGVMQNLAVIKPGSSAIVNFARAYRVFWNFSWTMTDNIRFQEMRVAPDWTFEGLDHFDELKRTGNGAIILTAHMGNYDLGAHLFAETAQRRIVMVRAPETDPETHAHETRLRERLLTDGLSVGFSGESGDLAIDLLHALSRGEIVAIQGDRVVGGVAGLQATLFGRTVSAPAGPFALAMAARVPIFPLFIVRVGRRHYKLITGQPFEVRRSRDRQQGFTEALELWTRNLEKTIEKYWYQWFTFVPAFGEDRH